MQENSTTSGLLLADRPYFFAEFFAGMGGMANAFAAILKEGVHARTFRNGHNEECDILNDEHFDQAVQVCDTIDHGHFAPPSDTFLHAEHPEQRNCDIGPPLRTVARPEGFGDAATGAANKVVTRTVALCLRLADKGRTFSLEHPWQSFIWTLGVMRKLLKRPEVELVLLHQCPYGALAPKATGVLTNSSWMAAVHKLCHEVRPHRHLLPGVSGHVWDFSQEEYVSRTSLMAEYPCGLCVAWARSLQSWLASKQGLQWVRDRTFFKLGRWGNTLVRGACLVHQRDLVAVHDARVLPEPTKSKQEKREEENSKVVGGLRDPRHAVTTNPALRKVGSAIRVLISEACRGVEVDKFEQEPHLGIPEVIVSDLRASLAQRYGAAEVDKGFQVEIWRGLLKEAEDVDAQVLPEWMAHGFPLGIKEEIVNPGVFPATEDVTDAIKASQTYGEKLVDDTGDLHNYVSFEEAGEIGQELLDKLESTGRAVKIGSWKEVQSKLGPEARLTRMACIVKEKEDKTIKARLVVDMKRSGVNGLMNLKERVILPRVSEVAGSFQQLMRDRWSHDADIEMMAVDFTDAFNMLRLCDTEKPFVLVKDGKGEYYSMQVVCFGLAPGPLLWGRVAAATMRLTQAVLEKGEGRLHCFVDDPIILAVGRTQRARTWTFVMCLAFWAALGLDVAWRKSQRGRKITWIGFELQLLDDPLPALRVQLPEAKRQRMKELFAEIRQYKGVFPLKLLQNTVGILGWLSSVVPLVRPWMAVLWAAISSHQLPKRDSTRKRKGLIFVKQVEKALKWLEALVDVTEQTNAGLQFTFYHSPDQLHVLMQTDACPYGMGGLLAIHGQVVAFWYDSISPEDLDRFRALLGDPTWQTEWEMLAALISLKVFAQWFQSAQGPAQVWLRADNTGTLIAATRLKASSPLLVQLAAEFGLELSAQGLACVWGDHVPGVLNTTADHLSRMTSPDGPSDLPPVLRGAQHVVAPRRDNTFYRAWSA